MSEQLGGQKYSMILFEYDYDMCDIPLKVSTSGKEKRWRKKKK